MIAARRSAAIAAALALAACGGGGAPAAPPHAVRVEIRWSDAAPEAVERELLEPLEAATAGLGGVVGMRGVATDGVATLDLLVRAGDRVEAVAEATRAAAGALLPTLPTGAEAPVVTRRVRPAAVIAAILPAGDASAVELGARAAALRHLLERLPGVSAVDVCGLAEPELQLDLDPRAVVARGLDPAQISAAVRARATTVPAGRLAAPAGRDALTIRTAGAGSVDELARVLVADGVHLQDVAQITLGVRTDCVALTPAGRAAILEVPVRARADLAAVLAALRAGGAQPFVGVPTVGRLTRPGAAPDQLEALAATLIARGAAAVRVHPTPGTLEILVDADATTAAGDATLAAIEELAVEQQLDGVRWSGPGVRAVEAIVDAPDLERALAEAAVAARTIAAAARAPVITPRIGETHAIGIDPDRAAMLGVPVAAIIGALRIAGGAVVTSVQGPDDARDVRLTWGDPDAVERLDLPVRTSTGATLPLRELVTISDRRAPERILHDDRRRAVVYWLRAPRGRTLSATRAVLAKALPGARVRTAELDRDRW
ncbi:MAG: efflux RND transporter permease subunit [Myxococcales bacterium]|nr:efflux RND transporter permease subunit [Myxococcales bacterium]